MFEAITAIVILLWMIPFAFKAKIGWSTIIRMILGVIGGGTVVVLGAVIANTFFEARAIPALGLTDLAAVVSQAFFTGFAEEGLKLLFALIVSIKMKSTRRIDYILVFGSVGAGFEIIESISAASDLLSFAFRVIFALHVVWLYYEGYKFFDAKNGKGLALIGGYITVAILHGLFDLGLMSIAQENPSDDLMLIGFGMLIVGILGNIIFIIRTIKKVGAAAKEQN